MEYLKFDFLKTEQEATISRPLLFKVRYLFCVSFFKKGIILWTKISEVVVFFVPCGGISFFFFLVISGQEQSAFWVRAGQAGQVFRK